MNTHKPPGNASIDVGPTQEMDSPYAPLPLDCARYKHYLDDLDVSKEEAQRFMGELWRLMGSFVDMGFGLDAAQIALDAFNRALEDECKARAGVQGLKALMNEAAAKPGKDKNKDE